MDMFAILPILLFMFVSDKEGGGVRACLSESWERASKNVCAFHNPCYTDSATEENP